MKAIESEFQSEFNKSDSDLKKFPVAALVLPSLPPIPSDRGLFWFTSIQFDLKKALKSVLREMSGAADTFYIIYCHKSDAGIHNIAIVLQMPTIITKALKSSI